MRAYAQAGAGGCGAQVFEDGWIIGERPCGPVFADFAEQAVLDGIPFGGCGGVAGYARRT